MCAQGLTERSQVEKGHRPGALCLYEGPGVGCLGLILQCLVYSLRVGIRARRREAASPKSSVTQGFLKEGGSVVPYLAVLLGLYSWQ